MKPRNKKLIVSGIHCLLWAVLLVYSLIMQMAYDYSAEEPLGAFLQNGVFAAFNAFFAVGLFAAIILLLSFRADNGTSFGRATVIVSALANVMSYVSVALLLLINRDFVLLFVAAWLVLALASLVMVVIQNSKA